MTITECIEQLQRVLSKHGNIQCESDCPYCGRSYHVDGVAVAPETARLNPTGGGDGTPDQRTTAKADR